LYPTCWNGKDLDSPNHQDHVAYPTKGPANFLSTGDCPASHPVKIPQLMLEVGPSGGVAGLRLLIRDRLSGIRLRSTTRLTGRRMARSLSTSPLVTILGTGSMATVRFSLAVRDDPC
jgi:hypothetical protein